MSEAHKIRIALALLLLLLASLAWLTSEVGNSQTMRFDMDVRNTIHQHASPQLTQAMLLLSFIGEPYIILPLMVVSFYVFWRTGLRRSARLFAFAMVGEIPIEQVMKWGFHRVRPQPFFGYALPGSYSFPSGHALTSLIFFGTLAALISPKLQARQSKIFLWLAAVLMVAGIGFSRIYLGVHYPTDVIGGYNAALVWVIAVWIVASRIR